MDASLIYRADAAPDGGAADDGSLPGSGPRSGAGSLRRRRGTEGTQKAAELPAPEATLCARVAAECEQCRASAPPPPAERTGTPEEWLAEACTWPCLSFCGFSWCFS